MCVCFHSWGSLQWSASVYEVTGLTLDPELALRARGREMVRSQYVLLLVYSDGLVWQVRPLTNSEKTPTCKIYFYILLKTLREHLHHTLDLLGTKSSSWKSWLAFSPLWGLGSKSHQKVKVVQAFPSFLAIYFPHIDFVILDEEEIRP